MKQTAASEEEKVRALDETSKLIEETGRKTRKAKYIKPFKHKEDSLRPIDGLTSSNKKWFQSLG